VLVKIKSLLKLKTNLCAALPAGRQVKRRVVMLLMKLIHSVIIVVVLFILGCEKSWEYLDNYIDHWEVSRTFESFGNSSLLVDTLNNKFEIVEGNNHVLLVTQINEPIFKPGKELADLYSETTILIELDSRDSLIIPSTYSFSTILRKLIAFSPDHGINQLYNDEVYRIEKVDSNKWDITLDLHHMKFEGLFDFSSNQKITDFIEY
jgi:hypothetical protein